MILFCTFAAHFDTRIMENNPNNEKKLLIIATIEIVIFTVLFLCASCNVTRKVTTESSYYQRGDTVVTITTKTTESYDASKRY